MRGKLFLFLAALPLFLCLCVSRAFAEAKFQYGVYERVRHEYWKNNRDMNSQANDAGDRNFFRFKTSVWGQGDYEDLLSLYVKLTNEAKSYTYYGGNAKKGLAGDSDEVIFDNLYLDVKKPGDIPVDFRIGRQDLLGLYGENFLIADGTPGDGSRTFYFNAVKASWTIDEKNLLDLVYLNDPKTDQYMPVFDPNKPETAVELSDATGFIVDLKNKSVENLLLEPYYIYKHEGADGAGLQSQTGRTHTMGAFTKYVMAPWTFHAQLADQVGNTAGEARQGLGGYVFVDRAFSNVALSPVLTAGYVYLSGDNKNTVKNEGFNPVFARFPTWSEIYAQSYQYESGNGYWTNLQLYRLQAALTLTQKAKFTASYSFLRANELVPASTVYSFSGTGKNRGSLYITKLDYAFTKNLSAYLLGEFFTPGNFYTDDADNAIFVRTQVEVKF